jgi:hypothetical protein
MVKHSKKSERDEEEMKLASHRNGGRSNQDNNNDEGREGSDCGQRSGRGQSRERAPMDIPATLLGSNPASESA